MASTLRTARTLTTALTLGGAAAAALAQGTAGGTQVYQQRLPDGRIVFSDRPEAGATTQRSWLFAPEDAQAAAQRRDAARREAQAVSERIQRQLDDRQERDERRELERLRLAEAQARLEAERARAEASRQPTVVHVPHHVVAHPLPHWGAQPPPPPRAVRVPPPQPPRPPRVPRPGPPKPSGTPDERR